MKFSFKYVVYIILLIALLACLGMMISIRSTSEPLLPTPPPTPVPTPTPTPVPTPTPEPEYYTISFVGDNTLASDDGGGRYNSVIENDMTRPYANVAEYFKDDDLSIANLECTISDVPLFSDMLFHFRTPSENLQILKNGNIDFVTTANNHSGDFGEEGLESTFTALDAAGISYGADGQSVIYETESGLKVGIFCAEEFAYKSACVEAINSLRSKGAEYIICALHWGNEGSYHPTDDQQTLAHALIDAGADVIYGSHPHVLQPVEEYNGGIIMYSLGNWSFGGNSNPRDMDTAIVQLTVKRDIDGSISTDATTLIPCRISSTADYNDYCPTPYEVDSEEYIRALSKLNGTFEGADLNVDYSFMYQTPTE